MSTVTAPSSSTQRTTSPDSHCVGSDVPFYIIFAVLGGTYIVLLVGLLVADVAYMVYAVSADEFPLSARFEWLRPALRPLLPILAALGDPKIQYSIKLTLISCLFTAV